MEKNQSMTSEAGRLQGIALKGLTLTEDEAKELQKALNDIFTEQDRTGRIVSFWTDAKRKLL